MVTPAKDFDVDGYCENLAKAGTEHAHQRAFFGWLNWCANTTYPLARYAYAIPNGGKRDIVTASRLKAEGVKAGVPDIHFPASMLIAGTDQRYLTLYIEMKAGDGRASTDQNEWHSFLRGAGHAVCVCWGWRAAVACFQDYVSNRHMSMEYKS